MSNRGLATRGHSARRGAPRSGAASVRSGAPDRSSTTDRSSSIGHGKLAVRRSWLTDNGRRWMNASSLFECPDRDALDERTLERQEEDHYRDDDERRRRHQEVELDVVRRLRAEKRQTHRERVLLRVLEIEQWSQEVVPGVQRAEEAHRHEGRPGLRHDDLKQDAKLISAVQPGGIGELLWNLHEELPEQEDPERR